MADESTLAKAGAVVGGGTVAVVGPDGRAGTVAADSVEQFLKDNPGWGLESQGAYQERIDRETYGDQTFRAGAEGFARGLTLGGSDLVARELGADVEAMAKRRKYNPITATVSEIGGAVAPALITAGAATPAGLVARAGAGLAEAAGGGLRGAITAGVAEGALYGAGAGVSNVALSPDPITPEALLTEIGSNALYGAAAGGVGAGVIHGAAVGGRAVLNKLSEKAAVISEKLAAKAAPEEAALLESVAAVPDTAAARITLKETTARATALRSEIAAEEKVVAKAAKIDRQTMKAEAATLNKEIASQESAYQKTSKEVTKEAESHLKDATERLKKQIADLDSFSARNLKQAERHPLMADPASDVSQAAQEVRALREEVQKSVGLSREAPGKRGPKAPRWGLADQETMGAAIQARDPLTRLQAAQNRLQRALGNKDYGLSPLSAFDDIAKAPKPGPAPDLSAMKQRLADLEAGVSTPSSPILDAKRAELAQIDAELQRFRSGAVEAESAKQTIDLAKKAGLTEPTPVELSAYHKGIEPPAPGSAADLVARASYFRDQAEKVLSKSGTRPGLFGRIATRMAGKAGDVAGAAVGGAVGGTTGALVGREVGSMAGEVVKGLLEGKAEMAVVAAKYSKKVSEGIQKFLKATEGSSKAVGSATARGLGALRFSAEDTGEKEPWKARMEEISRYKANPMAVRETVNANLTPIRKWDAFVADRMETSAVARLDYLAEHAMPKRPYPKPLGSKDRWEPTDAEKAKLERIAMIADNPLAVFDLLQKGRLTPDHVQTLKDLHPETFVAIQKGILTHLPELKEDLPYDKRLMLGLLFGVAVDPSLQPHVVVGIQERYKNEPGTDGGQHPPMADKQSIGSIRKSGETQTKAQRLRGAESER